MSDTVHCGFAPWQLEYQAAQRCSALPLTLLLVRLEGHAVALELVLGNHGDGLAISAGRGGGDGNRLAGLAGSDAVTRAHIAEALSYRGLAFQN
jgi:hypothetical protein